jgi:hypothetical protein
MWVKGVSMREQGSLKKEPIGLGEFNHFAQKSKIPTKRSFLIILVAFDQNTPRRGHQVV